MAKTQAIVITSDLTGEVIPEGQAEHVTFAVNGAEYSMDLTNAEAQQFMDAIGVYVDKAQTVKGGRRRRKSTTTTKGNTEPTKIRAWAEANGVAVSARGRVSADVRKQWEAAGKP